MANTQEFSNLILKKLLITQDYVRCRIKNTKTKEIIHYSFNGDTSVEYYKHPTSDTIKPTNPFKVPENHIVTYHEYESEKMNDITLHSFAVYFGHYSVLVDCREPE